MKTDSQALGDRGERWALRFLYRQGYDILERNYRCRAGEIDMIGYDGPVLAFVEVKTRSSDRFGSPGESLAAEQEDRIRRAALSYRRNRKLEDLSYRFDVVSIEASPGGKPNIKLIRDAF